jgi:multicomponent K+:H+ antiporter subunit F
MIDMACMIALPILVLAFLLAFYRLVRGPDVLDRVLALDTMVIDAIAFIVLLGVWHRSALSFEGALLLAMVGFLTTVAFCKFLLRGNVIE